MQWLNWYYSECGHSYSKMAGRHLPRLTSNNGHLLGVLLRMDTQKKFASLESRFRHGVSNVWKTKHSTHDDAQKTEQLRFCIRRPSRQTTHELGAAVINIALQWRLL